MEQTFRTVYWALFGMGESDVVELGDGYHDAFTTRIGYIMYGAYNIAAVIVSLNMLIAMMSRSFDIIQVRFALKAVSETSNIFSKVVP